MHPQGPRRTLPLRPPHSRAGRLSQAAPRALVGALRMRGRHTPAHCLSPLPTFLGGGSTWATAHCSQPPPRCQCKGYGGAAPAAFPLQLQLFCCCSCGSFPAAAVMQQHFGCCFRTAGAVALVVLPLLPTEGLWGCCTGSPPTVAATAVVPQRLRQLPRCSYHTAAPQLLLD